MSVTGNVPVWVGAPVKFPVLGSSDSPAGNEPDTLYIAGELLATAV